jgi:hypothetical protein
MTTSKRGPGQLIAGGGGVLLIVSLFLPWASAEGTDRSGWQTLNVVDVFLLIVGLAAIGLALTIRLPLARDGARAEGRGSRSWVLDRGHRRRARDDPRRGEGDITLGLCRRRSVCGCRGTATRAAACSRGWRAGRAPSARVRSSIEAGTPTRRSPQ